MKKGGGNIRSETEIMEMIKRIVNSNDYVPTSADLHWTRNAIESLKGKVWVVPSAGCMIICNHEIMAFDLIMNGSPTEMEITNFAKIRVNLQVLGYSDGNMTLAPDTKAVEDIHRFVGGTEEDIENAKVKGEKMKDDLQGDR